MATILFCWELGAGLGHVTVLGPLATRLAAAGHRVVLSLRDVTTAQRIFGGTGIEWVQAPTRARMVRNAYRPASTLPHILHNMCFGDLDEARSMISAWESLFKLARPDLLICDHSPTALLAARMSSIRRVAIGNGFFCPADREPLPNWRPWIEQEGQQLLDDERAVLAAVNGLIEERTGDPLARVSQLYAEASETLLTTFSELDHCGPRPPDAYWGYFPDGEGSGVKESWPASDARPRLFGYLKPFPALPALLDELIRLRLPTKIYMANIGSKDRRRFECETLHFPERPVCFDSVADQCEYVILNGTHGATQKLLLRGKPLLQIPLNLEQRMTAELTQECGVSLAANPKSDKNVKSRLRQLVAERKFSRAAQAFAHKYREFDARASLERAAARVEQLV